MKEMVRLELEREKEMREELMQMQMRNHQEKEKCYPVLEQNPHASGSSWCRYTYTVLGLSAHL